MKLAQSVLRFIFFGILVLIALGAIAKVRRDVPVAKHRSESPAPIVKSANADDWLNGSAADVFATLTRAGLSADATSRPRWEDSDWSAYCKLQLSPICAPPATAASSTQTPGTKPVPKPGPDANLVANIQRPPQRGPVASSSALDSAVDDRSKSPFSIFQSIYYNAAAVRWITQNCLNRQAQLDALLPNSTTPAPCPRPAPLPAGQAPAVPEPPTPGGKNRALIVVKTEWRLVHSVTPPAGSAPAGVKLDGTLQLQMTPLNVAYDGPMTELMSPAYVDVTRPTDPACRKLPGVADTPVYSLNCFFHRRVRAADFARAGALPREVREDLGTASCLKGNCYFILVGVHVISNEVPDWRWRTYWWTAAKPGLQWQNGDRGSTLSGNKWSFFDSAETVTANNRVANPYLEGTTAGGMKSNCMNCHQYAGYSRTKDPTTFIQGAASGLTTVCTPQVQDYRQNSLNTHFLWTLSLGHLDHSHLTREDGPCSTQAVTRSP